MNTINHARRTVGTRARHRREKTNVLVADHRTSRVHGITKSDTYGFLLVFSPMGVIISRCHRRGSYITCIGIVCVCVCVQIRPFDNVLRVRDTTRFDLSVSSTNGRCHLSRRRSSAGGKRRNVTGDQFVRTPLGNNKYDMLQSAGVEAIISMRFEGKRNRYERHFFPKSRSCYAVVNTDDRPCGLFGTPARQNTQQCFENYPFSISARFLNKSLKPKTYLNTITHSCQKLYFIMKSNFHVS